MAELSCAILAVCGLALSCCTHINRLKRVQSLFFKSFYSPHARWLQKSRTPSWKMTWYWICRWSDGNLTNIRYAEDVLQTTLLHDLDGHFQQNNASAHIAPRSITFLRECYAMVTTFFEFKSRIRHDKIICIFLCRLRWSLKSKLLRMRRHEKTEIILFWKFSLINIFGTAHAGFIACALVSTTASLCWCVASFIRLPLSSIFLK